MYVVVNGRKKMITITEDELIRIYIQGWKARDKGMSKSDLKKLVKREWEIR